MSEAAHGTGACHRLTQPTVALSTPPCLRQQAHSAASSAGSRSLRTRCGRRAAPVIHPGRPARRRQRHSCGGGDRSGPLPPPHRERTRRVGGGPAPASSRRGIAHDCLTGRSKGHTGRRLPSAGRVTSSVRGTACDVNHETSVQRSETERASLSPVRSRHSAVPMAHTVPSTDSRFLCGRSVCRAVSPPLPVGTVTDSRRPACTAR